MSDIRSTLTKTGVTLTFYGVDYAVLSDTASVVGGEMLVAADSDGDYTYYKIELISDASDLGFIGRRVLIYSSDSKTTANSGTYGVVPKNLDSVAKSSMLTEVFQTWTMSSAFSITQDDGTTGTKNFSSVLRPGSSDDYALYHKYVGTSESDASTVSSNKDPNYRLNVAIPADKYAYQEWEFDIYLANADSSVTVAFADGTDAIDAFAAIAGSDATKVSPSSDSTKTAKGVITPGAWKSVKFRAPINGVPGPVEVYVDNKLVSQSSADVTINGLHNKEKAAMYIFAENGKTSELYIDNLKVYVVYPIEANDIRVIGNSAIVDIKYSEITLNETTYTSDNVGGRILVAAYDNDGRLLKVTQTPQIRKVTKTGLSEVFYDFIDSNCIGYKTLKAFYWHMDDNAEIPLPVLMPYTNVIVHNAQ